MARDKVYLRYALKNKVYRATAEDLRLSNTNMEHDVVVVSVNKRSKIATVKTVTSLEYRKNGRWYFKNKKLNDVRSGKILPVPKHELGTRHYSGIHQTPIKIKIGKMFLTHTDTKFPKKYTYIINKTKRK